MKIFMRILAGLLVVIVIISAVLVLARNQIIKAGSRATIKAITGLDMEIGTLDISLFKPVVQIKSLKLFNPSGYPENLMMDLPELYAKYDLGSIIKGVIYLPELKVNLNEFVVVKTTQGDINVNSLKALQPPKGEGKPLQIKIDTVELHIGKVIYKEYGASGLIRVSEFKIDLNERYEHISDPNVLVALIVSKALRDIGVSEISATLKSADSLVNSSSELVIMSKKNVVNGVLKAADTVVGKTTKTIFNTLGKIINQ